MTKTYVQRNGEMSGRDWQKNPARMEKNQSARNGSHSDWGFPRHWSWTMHSLGFVNPQSCPLRWGLVLAPLYRQNPWSSERKVTHPRCRGLTGALHRPQKRHIPLEPVNRILFGKKIFAVVTKRVILRSDHPILSRWTLNPITYVLLK